MSATDLDQDHIDAAAAWTAGQLAATGCARIRLTPGDCTAYRIAIMAPGPEYTRNDIRDGIYFWVDLCTDWGGGNEWNGGEVHADYATEKWTRPRSAHRQHTGAVMAAFLTAVSHARRQLAAKGPECS